MPSSAPLPGRQPGGFPLVHSRRVAVALAAALLLLLSAGAATAHAWRLTIEVHGGGLVEETQNPESTRQKCGSTTSTLSDDLALTCVSGDIYCGLCNYTLKATPANGFTFSRYEWVRPTDITWSGTTSSWTWAFGNAGDFMVRAYFVDNIAPDTSVTGGPPEGGVTANRSALFTFGTTQAGGVGTYECALNGGTISCGSQLNLLSLPDGPKTLRVGARDPSGNLDPTPVTRTWTVDGTAPVTTLTGGPVQGSRTNSRTATFGVDVIDATQTFRTCRLNNVAIACGGSIQLSSLADGPYTLTASATDQAGNVGATVSRSWTVDTDAPATTLSGGPANGTVSPSTTATFTIGSDEPGTATCTLDGANVGCTLGELALTGLANGAHTLTVRATDTAGNQDPAGARRSWTVDATPPDTVIDSGPAGEVTDRAAAFAFSGAGDGGRYECSVDGAAFAACSLGAGHALSDLALGQHTLEVRAIDAAGNMDSSPASRSWTVIAVVVAPVVPGFSKPADVPPPALGRISITATVSWSSVSRKGLKLRSVNVTDAPKGAVIEVSCPGKKACAFAQKKVSTGKRVTLAKFAGKTFAPGASIAIKVTVAGMIGDYVVKKVNRPGAGRKGLAKFARQPLTTVRQCVPAGATAPAKAC